MRELWGLTGQTGAGKTTVGTLLKQLGCAVLDCDAVANCVIETDADCRKALCSAFGNDMIKISGELDRALLAERAFAGVEQTQRLNAIVHPPVVAELLRLAKAQTEDIVVLDGATLIESGLDRNCERMIAVIAPEDVRLARIMVRDGLTRERALLRMRAQPAQVFYTQRADVVIDGCMPLEQIRTRITALLEQAREGRR